MRQIEFWDSIKNDDKIKEEFFNLYLKWIKYKKSEKKFNPDIYLRKAKKIIPNLLSFQNPRMKFEFDKKCDDGIIKIGIKGGDNFYCIIDRAYKGD